MQNGVDLSNADVIVGTSAGSVVGAQITSGTPIEVLYERQLRPPTGELAASRSLRRQFRYLFALLRSRGDATAFGRRLGTLAIKTTEAGRTPTLEQRLKVIRSRLPSTDWPQRDLRITAIDARTGEFQVITKTDNIPLLQAVAASCAVPGVFPPVPIDGRPHIDGGLRSSANVDVARGCTRIVVLAPIARSIGPLESPQKQLDELAVPSTLITPNNSALRAIGSNLLDPAARKAAAEAGRVQAPSTVEQVRAVCK